MSHVLTPPSPSAAVKRFVASAWSDPDSRSIVIGVMAVLLVHSMLYVMAPYLLRTDVSHSLIRKHAVPRQFNIEISPDAFVKPPPKPQQFPQRYVEANPNAPDNVPDKTNNFSSQNQQLAQEKPDPNKHDDTPKLTGKKNVESNQTVSGQLTKPQDAVPAPPKVTTAATTMTAPKQAQDPLAGFEKMPDGTDGFGSNIGTKPDITKPMPTKVDGARDAPLIEGADSTLPAIDPKHPRARPVLNEVHTRPAIFQDNDYGTSNIGPVAYSAKWNSYGAYLHRMIEAIQIQWDRILIDSNTEPPSGSQVKIKFTLNSKGKIDEIIAVDNTSSDQGEQSCLTAITMTAPYGEWTPDMIAMLGSSQDLTFVFYYQ